MPMGTPFDPSAPAPFVPKAPPKPRVRRHWGVILRDAALILIIPTAFVLVLGLLQLLLPARVLSEDTPANHGLVSEDVRIRTADGLLLAAWYVPAAGKDDGSAILVLHGAPADKGDILARTAFLAQHHALLYLDFRYFGGSEGKYTTMGIRETDDALAGVAYLKQRGAGRIGIYGFSLGGAVALMAADRAPDVSAVVAEAPYATLRRAAEEPYARLGPLKAPFVSLTMLALRALTGTDADAVSPLAAASRSRIPTLLVHSRADQVVPFHDAELLQAAMSADPSAEFLFFDDQAHGAASTEFAARVGAFFDAHLEPKSP